VLGQVPKHCGGNDTSVARRHCLVALVPGYPGCADGALNLIEKAKNGDTGALPSAAAGTTTRSKSPPS